MVVQLLLLGDVLEDLGVTRFDEGVELALEGLQIRFDERAIETSLAATEAIKVKASERHLQQVLTIILINALDAMPFGGRLEISASVKRGVAQVTLTDTGVGIEPASLKGLFEPFATGRAEQGGTGLGLNVARWIMHKHGGDVAIASKGIGKGTTVTLTLPVA